MLPHHTDNLKAADGDIYELIQKEYRRQEEGLEMIASENYTSKAVMEAQGSILTNKYAEAFRESVTTVGVSLWMEWKIWPWKGPANSSGPVLPMSRPTVGVRPIWPPILPSLGRGTKSWG